MKSGLDAKPLFLSFPLLMVYVNCCFRFFENINLYVLDFKTMTPFHLAAKFGHFLLFNSFQVTDFGC